MIRITKCPPCSTPEQWKAWNRQRVVSKSKLNFCEDCTDEYKAQMTALEKCVQGPGGLNARQKFMEKAQ